MIRTGITYRFKQRVTEAGIFPGFFMGPSCYLEHRGDADTQKTAGFCIFMVAAACVIIY